MTDSPGNPRKDTRHDQIQRLKATFADGHYTEDPEQIAMRLVDHGHKLAALVTDHPPEVPDDRQPES